MNFGVFVFTFRKTFGENKIKNQNSKFVLIQKKFSNMGASCSACMKPSASKESDNTYLKLQLQSNYGLKKIKIKNNDKDKEIFLEISLSKKNGNHGKNLTN